MTGLRVAVFGLGRSGLAAARALKVRGATPIVFDERPLDAFNESPLLYSLLESGIAFEPGFDGVFRGVDMVVTSPGVPKFHPALTSAALNGIHVIGEVELAYRISKAPIVAITGTNGKSTTTLMTYLCLQSDAGALPLTPSPKALGEGELMPVLCGNIYGSGYPEIPLTEAADLSGPENVLVAEISSFQLEWVETFAPKAAIVTNVTQDHLNRYADFNEYAATKRRIFDQMTAGDTAVWRSTDPLTEPFGSAHLERTSSREPNLPAPAISRFGRSGDDAFVDGDALYALGVSVPLSELPFEESHNLLNAMAAVLLAHAAAGQTVSADALLVRLKRFHGLAHRMERVGERDGVLLINNSMCTNPGAVIASSLGLKRDQRLLIGGINKDMDFAPLREYLDQSPHYAYLFGTDGEQINRQLGGRWPVFSTMREAFDAAVLHAKSGEVVMLAPGAASVDQFVDFRDRGEAFRAMAMEWLNS